MYKRISSKSPSFAFAVTLVALLGVSFKVEADEWAGIEDEMILPVQKIAGSELDADAACEMLQGRAATPGKCRVGASVEGGDGSAHLIFIESEQQEEVYIGVRLAKAKATRYFPIGRYVEQKGGTQSLASSSLTLVELSSMEVSGQPALIADLQFLSVEGNKFGYYDAMETCYDKLKGRNEYAPEPTEDEQEACVDDASASFVPIENRRLQDYRYIFIGEKLRLSAAYLAREESYEVYDGKQGLSLTKETSMHFDGLSWSIEDLSGKKQHGSLKDRPALLFDFNEGKRTWWSLSGT